MPPRADLCAQLIRLGRLPDAEIALAAAALLLARALRLSVCAPSTGTPSTGSCPGTTRERGGAAGAAFTNFERVFKDS